jgi:hypothetical protein
MKTTDLKLNPDNPRLIKDERFKKLCKSIQEFPKMMELRPIVIDRTQDNLILGGNMRYRALKELKFKDIPDEWVKDASELTEEEKKRFIIEDNVPFGEWDFDLLANSWGDCPLVGWGLELPVVVPEGPGEPGIVPPKDPNVICRISFHPGLWLGKREEILLIFEQMKKTYDCEVKVEE